MARHSKLVIFYQAFQGGSQYLGHPIATDTFLRSYTSMGLEWENWLQFAKSEHKETHVWLILPGNPQQCTWPVMTIVLNGSAEAMTSTVKKPHRLQRQTATWNKTRLQTYCWPVYAIRTVVWLLCINTNTDWKWKTNFGHRVSVTRIFLLHCLLSMNFYWTQVGFETYWFWFCLVIQPLRHLYRWEGIYSRICYLSW